MPVFNGQIPFLWLKYRSPRDRFTRRNSGARAATVEEVLRQDELERILRFCDRLCFNYGELDLMRDIDGKIYIMDANNTPGVLPSGFSPQERRTALDLYTKAFRELMI